MKSTNTKKKLFLRLYLLLAAAAMSTGPAWGQCSCTQTLSASPAYGTVVEVSSGTLCINPGVTVSGATIRVTGNNVTICNSGTIGDNYSGNGYGTIDVASGITGTVINNLGIVNTQTARLQAAVTLNNGSSDGGTTVVAATWSGYIGGTITVAPTIHNYSTWQAGLQPIPGGTITNAGGATWNAYLTTSANLTITNAGTWSSQVQEGGNNPTISIIQNGGSWTGGLGGGNGSLRIVNNATWTQDFNFPGGSANAFTNAAGATSSFNGYLGLGGTVALVNNGTMNVNGGMGALGSTSSLLNAAGSTFALTGDFTNQGTVANLGTITGTGNFTNEGTITGATTAPGRGLFRIASYTVNSSSFGADGSYLDFCDGTPPSPASNGFDVRGGTVGANVTFCASSATPTMPLPVSLTSFSAQRRGGQVLVQWATASELNNQEFVVERSADGRAFVALQTVAGRGTLTHASTYAATDERPLPGFSYYRLRQVDHDGTRTYSPVATVSGLAAEVVAYPNPTADVLTLDLSGLAAGPCQVRLRSLPGQLVLSATLAAGQAQLLSLAGLPTGTYLLEVASAAQGRQVQRVVKR